MNAILFGAGASYGQAGEGQAGEGQPPLISGLYEALKIAFPNSWGNVPSDLDELFSNPKTFERGITKLIQDAFPNGVLINSDKPEPQERQRWRTLQWDLAEFFFKFVPTQENLYDQFFKKLHPMRLMSLRVATLNYDRLLQLAARSRKIGLNYGGEPNWAEPLAPCLPHGTSYLASRMRMIRTDGGYAISGSGEINTMGAGLTIEGPLVELASAEELEKRRSEDFFPPAMSYVDPQKLSASGNSFLSQQQGVWASWVEHAERVAIVGVSVRTPDAPDAHLWKPLSTARAELLYVNPSNEECTKFRAWSAGYKRKDPDPIGETWEAASDKVVKFLRTRRTCGA